MKVVSRALALLLALYCVTASPVLKEDGKKMVCYYGSWSVYRYSVGLFQVEDIDPYLCTHIIFTFAGLDNNTNTIMSLDPYNDMYDNFGLGAYERFVGLKKKNPSMKALLAVGGWNEESEKYSVMASTAENRATFVQSAVDFILRFGFDGLDFDWEYPFNRGGVAEDYDNFITLSRELKTALAAHDLMLTAAVSCGKYTIDTAYNIPAMNQIYDQIHLMCYDLHGAWEDFTHLNAPLYTNTAVDFDNNSYLSVDYAVNYWLDKGADPSLLILGMALYGRGWTLNDPNDNGIYATAYQPIDPGPYTGTAGFWGYNEIMEKFQQGGWNVVYDPVYRAPYAYKGRLWIGYDNVQSVTAKANYVLQKGLGGAMVWSVDTDDFRGLYHDVAYPLTRTVTEIVIGPVVIPTPDPNEPTTTTTSKPTAPPGICTEAGFVRDPEDCAVFYQCSPNGQGGFTATVFRCVDGTVFDLTTNSCAFPDQVPGCEDYPGH